jgi:hypothetical protein
MKALFFAKRRSMFDYIGRMVECPFLAGDCLTTIGGADPQVTDARLQAVAEAR